MLSTVRNNAVRRNFGLGQAPCLSSITTKSVTSPIVSNHRAQWHARREYRTTQGLEARKSSAGQMMAEALGILQSAGVANESTETKPKRTRTRKTKVAEEDVDETTEAVEKPKRTRAKKVTDRAAEDGEQLVGNGEEEQPPKKKPGRKRKDAGMTREERREAAVEEKERIRAEKKLVADTRKKITRSKKPSRATRAAERSMLRPCVDPMQEQLYDTGVWAWLDYGRSTTKLTIPSHLKKVDKSRVHITSEKLVDDILSYMKPSLMRHEGCDIIDINPGAGVWSTKLNDLLKPRTHLLLEPDGEFYKPMLEPLLQREGTKLVEKDGVVWAELLSVLTPKYLPHQKEHRYTADDVPQRNDTLLVTANLGSYPKKKYSTFPSATAMILYQFNHAIRSGALFQKYGLVRMLLWIDDSDRPAILPHIAQRRRRMAVDAELNCEYIMHVAGPDYSDLEPDKKGWFNRDANIDRGSALATLKCMREAGIVTPPGRETKLLREISQQDPSKVVTAGEVPMTYDFRHQAELERLEAELEAGAIAIDSPDHKLIRRMRVQIRQANKRFSDVHANLTEYLQLIEDWRAAKAAGGDEAALSQIMARYKEYEQTLIGLGSTAMGDWFIQRDNLHLWNMRSMFWDRRTIEPLVISNDEFFPHVPLSLLDIQPKAAAKVLRSMGPGSDRSGDMAELLMRNMLTYVTSPMSKVLDRLAPGASESVYPLCTSLFDPNKGGVPFPGTAELTVRGMSASQYEDILEQWMKWPFKPSLQDLVSCLSDEYKDTEDEGGSGKFGGVSPEF